MKTTIPTIMFVLFNFYLPAQTDGFGKTGKGVIAYYQEQYSNPRRYGTVGMPELTFSTITTNEYYIHSGDFDSQGTLWAVTGESGLLITITPGTGAVTVIGPLTGVPPNHYHVGLSFDPLSGSLYFISDDVNSSATDGMLYSVNQETGEMTPIGELGTPQPAWLEIDNNGNAYMGDANTNSLYTVDLSTGEATLIGSFGGINLDLVRHGASFDHASNTLYMVATIIDFSAKSHFYTVNLSTGEATDLGGSFFGHYALFAIPMEQSNGFNDNAALKITAYPNPTNGDFNIVLGKTYDEVSAKVMNQMGQVILSEIFKNTDKISLEIEGADGVYFVVIESDGHKDVTRLILDKNN